MYNLSTDAPNTNLSMNSEVNYFIEIKKPTSQTFHIMEKQITLNKVLQNFNTNLTYPVYKIV